VLGQYSEYDRLRQALLKAKHAFADTKEQYADVKIQTPEVESLKITDQIRRFEEASVALNHEYKERTQAIQEAFAELKQLFDQLGEPISERGEFSQPPKRDLTPAQLVRAQDRISSLKEERKRRRAVLRTLRMRLQKLAAETHEPIPPKAKAILSEETVTPAAIKEVEDANEALRKVKTQRESDISRMKSEVGELYRLLRIDVREQKTFPNAPTAENVAAIGNELKKWESQSDSRLGTILASCKAEVDEKCKELAIADWKKPRYHGDDKSAAITFYMTALEELKELSTERSQLLEMSQSPDRNEGEYERTLDHFRSRTGTIEFSSGTRHRATRTELSASSALFVPSPRKREDLSVTVKNLFAEQPQTPQDSKSASKRIPASTEAKRTRISPKQKRLRDTALRARNPFRP
jgi:hypothetical protein